MATTSTLTATNSFSNTPQAQGDAFYYSEDLTTVVTLDVMANDLGGAAKTLWSVDNSIGSTTDLLTQDTTRAESTSSDTSLNGAKIWITSDGKVGYDSATLSASFKAQLQALGDGQTLTDTFTYAIRLGNGTLSWTTATVVYRGANDAPVLSDPADITVNDTAATDHFSVTTGTLHATDVDSSTITYGLTGSAADASMAGYNVSKSSTYGTMYLNTTTGAYKFVPNDAAVNALQVGSNPTVDFQFTASDGSLSSGQTLTVHVNGANDAPDFAAATATASGNEDTTITGSVTATDVDTGDTRTYSVVNTGTGAPAHGSVSIDANTGAYSYTPAGNYNGTDSFIVTVTDAHGAIDTIEIDVTVNSVNDAPAFASDTDTASGDEDTTITGQVTATDPDTNDASPDTLSYSVVNSGTGAPAHGSVSIDANTGEYSYTPDANYNGSDSFVVTVTDSHGATDTIEIDVTVNSVNDVPAFASDTDTASGDEDTTITGQVTATDPDTADASPDTLSYSVVNSGTGAPDHGSVSIDANTGEYSYTPDANYNGSDSFVVTVTDSHGATDTIEVDVTVNSVNDVPAFATDTDTASGDEDTTITGQVTATDPDTSDATPDTLSYSVVNSGTGAPAHGSVSIDANTGEYSYTPDGNYNGSDSFVVTVTDSHGATDTIEVDVTVNSVNDVPAFATDTDTASGDEDTTITGQVTATDPDTSDATPDTLTYTVVNSGTGAPAHGSVSIDANTGEYSYTPDTNYNGSDAFVVTVTDSHGATDTIEVDVTVDPVNDAPVINEGASDLAPSGNEDTAITGSIVATDVDGDTLTYTAPAKGDPGGPAHGTVSFDSSGGYTYTPDADYNGSDSFTVTVSDGAGGTDTVVVNLTVDPVNDAPVINEGASNLAPSGNEDTSITGSIVATDVDGDTLTYTAPAKGNPGGPAHGSVSFDSSGGYTYTPDANYNGSDSFTVTVSDGHGGTDTVVVGLTVNPVNDAPVINEGASSLAPSGNEDTAITGAIAASDVDGDTLTYTAPAKGNPGGPAHGSVSFDSSGGYTYTPDANYNGSDSFTVTVSDGHGGTDTVAVSVTVNPVNDAPSLTNPNDISYVDTSATDDFAGVTASLSASDIDGDTLTYGLTGAASDGSLSGYNVSKTSAYGTMYLNTATGAYHYEPNDSAINAVPGGSNPTDSFTFSVSDGHGGSALQTLDVNITGANEAPSSPVAPAVYNGTDDPNDMDTGGPAGTVYSSPSSGANNILGTNGVDNISAGNGVDVIYGLAGNDTLSGDSDTDTIYGGEGNDIINGGQANDILYGGSGNDTIHGDSNVDTIIGGYGADTLTGDANPDTFVYLSTKDTGDTITDFTHGVDKIDLSALDANGGVPGDQAFTFVALDTNAVQANSVTYHFDSVANVTHIWADVNGDTTADIQIDLTGNITLTSTDFIL